MDKCTILITDEHPSYKKFVIVKPGIKHKTVNVKEHVHTSDKTVHLQKVNNTNKQLRDFSTRFNGVRSKYLQNYLNWYAYGKKNERIYQPIQTMVLRHSKLTNSLHPLSIL